MKTRLVTLLILLWILFVSSCDIPRDPYFDVATSAANSAPTLDPYPVSNSETSEIPATPSATPTRQAEACPGLPALHGVNLGNALDAPWPGAWGVTMTEAMIQSIADAGFNATRLPVRFSAYTGAAPDYALSESILATVDQIILWGLDAGLIILLDVHHFNSLMQSPTTEEARFLAIWEQLASRYQSLPATVYFELLNEPHGEMDAETWNRLVAQSMTLIRQTNPTRTIVIGGVDYSRIEALEFLVWPDDPHLAAAFHYYEPFEFTHQGASWLAGSSNWLGTSWTGTPDEAAAIQQAFDRAVDWSNAHQIPLILGEFGAIGNAESTSRQTWTGAIARTAERRGIGWFYWDLCSEFGLYNCEKGKWDKDLLDVLLP